jgi:hypothetical protein
METEHMSSDISKKLVKSAVATVAAVVAIVITGTVLLMFEKIDVDIPAIQAVGSRIVVQAAEGDRPISVYIPDEEGNISSTPFKILSFTDTHFDTYRRKGRFTMDFLIKNIQIEKPDLVVIVGDVFASRTNRARVKQLCEVMEKLGVYWIPVLGNHEGDNLLSISREKFIDIYSSYPHCLIGKDTKTTAAGEKVWGCGNTQINILTAGGAVSQSLFFLDSGNEISKEDAKKYNLPKGSTDYVKPSQVEWYKERAAMLDEGVKSMVFLHIPLPEYIDAYEAAPKTADGALNIGVEAEDGTIASFGNKGETICSAEHNGGLFDAIAESGSTQAVVVGHDHVNNFRIRYKGVWLCYNRSSGYSSYNMVTKKLSDKLAQGASIYTIHPDGEIEFGDIINGERFDDSGAYKLYK